MEILIFYGIIICCICLCCSASIGSVVGPLKKFFGDPFGVLFGTQCAPGDHDQCGPDKYCSAALKCEPRISEGVECGPIGANRVCQEGLGCFSNVPNDPSIKCRKIGKNPGDPCQALIHDTCEGSLECNTEGKCVRGAGQGLVGEPCIVTDDCKDGVAFGSKGVACCGPDGKKTCQQQVRDHAGIWYCPDACVGEVGGQPGTCKKTTFVGEGGDCSPMDVECEGSLECSIAGICIKPASEGPRPLGSACAVGADCDGYTAVGSEGNDCCNGKCVKKVKDYTGNWYCPHEAKKCPPGFTDFWGGTCYTDQCIKDGGKRTASCSCDFGSNIEVSGIDCGTIGPLGDGAPCDFLGPGWFKTTACNCQKGGLLTNCARYGQSAEAAVG